MSNNKDTCDCKQLREIVYGAPGRQRESIVWVLSKHDEIINGTSGQPRGLLWEVSELRRQLDETNAKVNRLLWVGVGAATAINIGWMLYTHFHKAP